MRIESAPTLEDPQFYLRPIELSDMEAWYGYLAMPRAIEHTSWNLKSIDDLRPVIAGCNSDDPSSSIRFAIIDQSTGRFIGNIGFHTISPVHRTAELTYDLHPDYWGRGIASMCCRAVVAWGFAARGYMRVQATTLDTNKVSAHILEKCEFAFEGMLRNFRMVRGVSRDYRMYAQIPG